MFGYLVRLREWMQEHPPDYVYEDANSLLEMLYFDYGQRNILDADEIREKFRTLDVLLDLPPNIFMTFIIWSVSFVFAMRKRPFRKVCM